MSAPLSPVVVDGIVSEERLRELLRFQSEYHNLDYKEDATLCRQSRGRVELVKDIGAMQVHGGYVVIGVDGKGEPSERFHPTDQRQFDEANLRNTACQYLPSTISSATQHHQVNGHPVILICIGPHPDGLAVFHSDGVYTDTKGKPRMAFSKGDVLTRIGTQSTQLSQDEWRGIIDRQTNARLAVLRREEASRMYDAARAGFYGESLASGPIDAISFDLDWDTLESAVVELLRRKDRPGLLRLLARVVPEARRIFGADHWESEMSQLFDSLAVIGSVFIELEEDEWFERLITQLVDIYGIGLESDFNFEWNVNFPAGMKEPRLWLLVILRVYALGALAVRRHRWSLVRTLAVRRDARMWDRYFWLRHAVTMASRGRELIDTQGRFKLSLLNLARQVMVDVPALRPGLGQDSDEIISHLAQFDFLGNAAMLDAAPEMANQVIYPNFARFRSERIDPAAQALVSDDVARRGIFHGGDSQLAAALRLIAVVAAEEGVMYDGFVTYSRPVLNWLDAHQS